MRGRVWSPSSLLTVGRGQWEAEGASGKRGRTRTVPQHGKAVSSEVTSGCPKRSEGGCPVGTRTNTAFRAEPSIPGLSKRNYT